MYYGGSPINIVIAVGEVVDRGTVHMESGYISRFRLKLRVNEDREKFAYIELYSNLKNAEDVALISQIGNIVYVEGSYHTAKASKHVGITYIRVDKVRCLRRPKDMKLPNTDIISLLDLQDPIGYMKVKKSKEKEEKTNG